MPVSDGLKNNNYAVRCSVNLSKYCIIIFDYWVDDTEENRKKHKDWVCAPCYAIKKED